MITDKKLPSWPHFHHHEVTIGGEAYDVYFHDILKCVQALYRNPVLSPILVFAPEHHYADANKTEWLFHDMHTRMW